MATHSGNAGNIIALPQWLPATDAAKALGIAERTLRLRAERGQVARRRDGRAVLYQVTPATHSGMPVAVANVIPATPATPATDAGNAPEASALVNALVGAVERATRVELEHAAALAELERMRVELASVRSELANAQTEIAVAHKGWSRAHAGWQVARAALDRLTGGNAGDAG